MKRGVMDLASSNEGAFVKVLEVCSNTAEDEEI